MKRSDWINNTSTQVADIAPPPRYVPFELDTKIFDFHATRSTRPSRPNLKYIEGPFKAFIVKYFSGFEFVRKKIGGKWECWYIETGSNKKKWIPVIGWYNGYGIDNGGDWDKPLDICKAYFSSQNFG